VTAGLLARIVLRIFGIYFLFQALSSLYQLAGLVAYPLPEGWGEAVNAQGRYALILVVQFVAVGSFGLACLVNTGFLARKLFPECGDQEVALGGPGSGAILFRLLAVGFLVYAVPGVLQAALEILWYLGGERRHLLASVLAEHGADHLFWLMTVVLAVLVFRNAERLARGGR